MSREPHGPVRRLSMLIVAVPCLLIGGSLLYHFLPEELPLYERTDEYGRTHYDLFDDSYDHHGWLTPGRVGAGLTVIGIGFVVTALTPYRPRTEEEEDARGEYPYTVGDRRKLRQWGD
jgi:hypothetical protein